MGLGEVEESGNEGAKMAKTMQVASDDGCATVVLDGWGLGGFPSRFWYCMGVFGVTKIFRKSVPHFRFGG